MASLNSVKILGRLGRDPELKHTQSGQPVATMSVATDESYKDSSGTKVEKTEWHRVNVWGRTAENCAQYLGKGSLVLVEGSLQTRKWQDKDGQDRYTTEIKAFRVHFLDKKDDGGGGQRPAQGRPAAQGRPMNPDGSDYDPGPAFPSTPGGMDDVPF